MKYFKFWIKDTFKISIDGKIKEIKLLVGSNISKEAGADFFVLKSRSITHVRQFYHIFYLS